MEPEPTIHHIYNRGAHKAPIFLDRSDYERMLMLLYIANCSEPFVLRKINEQRVFEVKRKDTLVDIVCYCLMPNHIHIAVKQRPRLCISQFMHKLCTGYSGYFNRKNIHSGTIWQGPYKEKFADDLEYGGTLINYIHLNPYFGIKEPDLTRESRPEHLQRAIKYSREYEFSSFKDYLGEIRPQTAILCSAEARPLRKAQRPRLCD